MQPMEDHDRLFNFISRFVSLTQEERMYLASKLQLEQFNKADCIIKEGQVCRSLRFVGSGIYRVYKTVDGNDITSYFNYAQRNPFVASFVSLLTGKPSNEYVECIEAGEVLVIAYEAWQSLYAKSHSFNTFGRLMAEYNYVLAIERIDSLQHKSATDRYNAFMKLYPGLLNMIPHHYIATYLGITPESLSRIRKKTK